MKRQPKFTIAKATIAEAITYAFSDVQQLADEMRSWADNMEEKLSHTEKYDRVSECADTLEGCEEPTVETNLEALEVTYPVTNYGKRNPSRAARCGDAVAVLQAIVERLNEIEEPEATEGAERELFDNADTLRDELENTIGELESVEFPGMYG